MVANRHKLNRRWINHSEISPVKNDRQDDGAAAENGRDLRPLLDHNQWSNGRLRYHRFRWLRRFSIHGRGRVYTDSTDRARSTDFPFGESEQIFSDAIAASLRSVAPEVPFDAIAALF